MQNNKKDWRVRFSQKFGMQTDEDFGYLIDDIQDFIAQVEKDAYTKGQKEARCHYYDMVRKEAQREVLREVLNVHELPNIAVKPIERYAKEKGISLESEEV